MADKYNDSRTAFRHGRIAKGLCRDCGKVPFESGRVVCDQCHIKRSDNGKEHSKKRLRAGICLECGGWNDKKGNFLCSKCSQKRVEKLRHIRKRNKEFIIHYFGGDRCKECGEQDIRCLSLDHINNDGKIDKTSKNDSKQITPTWYAKLVKLIKNNQPLPRQLQLLCFNCHAKKDLKPWWFK